MVIDPTQIMSHIENLTNLIFYNSLGQSIPDNPFLDSKNEFGIKKDLI